MKKHYTTKATTNNYSRALVFLAFLLLISVCKSYSQVRVPFAPRASSTTPSTTVYTIKGDFTMIGNTNLTLENYTNTANNNADMVYVDIDGDPNTWNSSSATLTFSEENNAIPECSNIIYAGLYWTGRAGADETFTVTDGTATKDFDKRKVQLKKGTSGVYQEIIAATTTDINKNIYFPSGVDDNIYSAYAEITDYVVANGLGEYFVADIATLEGNGGNTGYYGGWGMVVIYENSKMNWRDVTVFDGHAFVRREGAAGISTNYTFDVDGFNTAENGYINIKLGTMAGEGDVGVSGDTFSILNRTTNLYEPLSHSGNSTLNFFNSSINTGGNPRTPSLLNNTGVDIAMFEIDNGSSFVSDPDYNKYITNEQTSTSFQYGTSQDTYVIFNVTFSVDAYIPETEIIVQNTTNNTSLTPGESTNFTIEIKNTGTEATENTILNIPIPLSVDPNNLTYNGNVNPVYAPLDNYSAPTITAATAGNNGTIVWNMGTLPLPNNPDDVIATLTFEYTVTTDCSTLTDPDFDPYVTLLGMISGTGQTSGQDFSFNLIQGYETIGPCTGDPIVAPLQIPINYEGYVNEPPTASDPEPINIECIDDLPSPDVTVVTDESDNSGIDPIVAFVSDTSDGNTCPEIISRVYSVTDDCNNTINVTQTITISITTPLVMPDDGANTVDCIANATETFSLPTITDVCGNTLTPSAAVITESPDPLTCEGTRTYTYTYTDCANNSDTWAYVYTIDTPAFTITDTDGANTVDCIANATETFSLPTITDVCGNTLTPSAAVITENPDPLTCEGTRTYTYTYTDCANNSDTWAYVYTIDTPAFTITDTDGANTVDCIANATETFSLPTITDVCGNTLTPSAAVITESPDPLTCEGTRTYTYTYTDCANNSDTWAYVYTIDTPAFTITDTDGANTVDCIANATETFSLPTITDVCGNTLTPSAAVITESPDPLTCEGTRTYTYTYTDCANNSDTWAYVYTIDTPAFTITDTDGANTVDCIANATETFSLPTITDVCGNTLTPSAAVITESPDPLTCEGTRTYTYTYTDCANNSDTWAYVYTIDTPAFTITDTDGANTVDCIANATETFSLPTITDVCGNTLTPSAAVITESPDPLTCEGTRTYTYTYTDCANNSDTWAYVYTIDTPAFTITDTDGANTVDCIANATETFSLPTITDVCGNTLTPSAAVITESPDPLTCEGTRTYTYTYTDCANNSDTWAYVYTIDTPAFTITDTDGANTVDCIANATETFSLPTITDVCGNTLTPSAAVITENPDPLTCEGSRTYTYTYTDCANNSDTWAYVYTIDTPAFTITDTDGANTVDCIANATETFSLPTITDVCGNTLTPSAAVITENPDPLTCEGSRTYTYTYTDCANNSDTWAYVYTIDTPAFTITDTDGANTVDCIANATETFSLPTITDVCGNTLTPSAAVITENPDPLTCEGTRTYTYTYTDCANNSDTWAYVYTIDTPAFTITDTDGANTVDCIANATETFSLPTITDVCGNTLTPSAAVITESPDPLTCEGTRTYTYTYTDCANNSDTWAYVYTIDTPAFTITDTDGANTVDCIANATETFSLPTITDVCGNTLTPSAAVITESPDPLTCEGTRTYTYTYTDCANNSDTWAYVYTIDTPAFTITDTDGANTVDCIANATETFSLPTITDVCGNTLTPSAAVITESPDPLTCEGTRTYTYTYTDCANNSDTWAYVYTIDTPAFTITDTDGANTVDCIANATETFSLPTITDVCGNTLTPSAAVITESPDPLTCEGTRTYTYTYTDCANNSDTWAYVYTIDTPAFTITDTDGANTVDCIANATETFSLPTITDVCGNTLTPSAAVITENPDPLTCEGTRTYTYTYTDCANNSDTWAYVYTIDTPAFTITDTDGANTVDCIANATETFSLPTITDVCGNTLTPSAAVITESPDPLTCEGTRTYTYTYTDCANNSDTWAYVYTIDTPAFTITDTDGANTVDCIANATETFSLPTITDVCGNTLTPSAAVITESPDPLTCEGTRTYTYTYTDCANNSDTWAYVYTIDTPAFTITDTDGANTVDCIANATETFSLPTITDVCGNTLTPSAAVITESPDPLTCEGTRTYTYTYTDCANNSDTWAYVYTIDTPAFTITDTDGANTVDCIANATETFSLPTITDVCGNTLTPSAAVITESPDPLTCEGTRTYTYTYTDCANNSDTWAYVYTIDLTPFILPSNGIETVDNLADAVEPTPPTITDNCGNTIIPSAPTKTDTPDCQGSIVYTFTYIDCAGNSANWAYTYTIELAPFTVPANDSTTVECIADATAPTPPIVVDANGDDVIPVMTENDDPTCEGDKIYTFTYTDCAGNAGVWEYTYTIDVTTAPVVPTNVGSTVECIADATQPTAPVVTDVCGNNIIPVITDNTDPICEGDKIYTFTYTDCAGNESVYIYTYTIDVITAPVVTTNAGSTVECIADATQPSAPVVTDVCGNEITAVITENNDPTCEGDKIYTFTYTDCAGNESVYIYTYTIDVTSAPIVPTNAGSTVECIAEAIQPTAPVLTDVCGNDITPVITENTDPTCEGDKIYTFTYTDCAGNESVYIFTYTIDLTPFILPSNGIETVDNLADAVEPTPPTVTDNCGNTIIPSAPTKTDTPDCQGSIVYTFTYIDCAGNSANWAYTYTIELAPFTVPANDSTTVECIADATAPTPPIVVDANGDDVIPVMTENDDPTCEGDKIYTFTYTDCAGNAGVWEYTYTIDVTTAPVVPTNVGSTVECIADATQPTAPVVTDVCGNDIIPVITDNTDPICEGDKIYTFTYTDCAGNESVYIYTYTIDVITAPVVTTNAGSTVECIADATQPSAPVVTDVCGNEITAVITENNDPTCEGDKIYTFTYTDCAGNESVYIYTYTIDVTSAPIVPTNAGSTVECIAEAIQPTAPVLTDVCGNDITPVITENTDPTCEGDKIYTFTYTDCAGNESVYIFTYTIDLTPFILPSNGIETVDNLADAVEPTPPTVTDNCGNTIIPSAPTKTDTPDCQGSIVYTFTYIDCAGNSANWAYTYTIELAPFTVPANDSTTVECIADATAPTPPIVVDANGDDVIPVMTENDDPTCEGDKIYTFTYTDCAGNAGVWEYTYTIDVTTAPVVPTNVGSTVECIADATQPTAPVVTDVCGNDIIPVITDNTDPICEGDKIYTFTYTDCAGNESVYIYTYTIDVITAPVVTTNAGSTVECIADATQPSAPVVTDVCGNEITAVITENNDPTCEGDKIYTFTYTDCAGNESVYIYTYTIDVTSAPIVPTNAGSTVECIAEAIQPTAPVLTDVCGNDITPVITENTDPTCEGDKIYTFTYTDCAGNESVYIFTYTIKDTIAPVLTLPANVTAECSDDLTPIEFGAASATDNCDANPIVTFNDVIENGTCSGNFSIIRTWTATDACGNSVSADQIISTADTTSPVFDQTMLPGDVVVECDDIPTQETLTATDNCGTATVTVTDVRTDGNCPNNYIITRSYTAKDECGVTNTHVQIITVQDSISPTFVETLPNTNIVAECDAIPVAEMLTATDTCGSAIVTVSDARTNGNCPNNYTLARTWVATDECGLTTSYTQIIVVQDTTAPTFVESLPRDITVECDNIPEVDSLTAIDNCGDAIVTVNDVRTDGNCTSNYTITRTWTATDECGLTTTHNQTIIVQDTTAPEPASAFAKTLDVSCTDIPEVLELEFIDNCSANVIVEFDETNTFNENVIADYQIIRTWTVRDACNNEESYTQTLNVALDEILNEVVAEDRCFDDGVINLNNYLAEDTFGGTWEIIEGNTIATINGSIFDPTNLDSAYSESFNPNTDGMQYVLRYTGFQDGCINVSDVIMIVDASCKVLPCGAKDVTISTAITPNGDDYNETFDIEGITLCGFIAEVKIFNRWGALVYESNEYTLGSEREGNAFGVFGKWNGTSPKSSIGNNGKLPNGTYYYIINLRNSGLDPITGPIYLGTK